jgi:putative transposase
MPRKTRMYLPGVPVHIVQRGNNRNACFFCEDDYRYYKQVLEEGMQRYGVALHAYCLMTNHVHLLMTPQWEDSISRVIQHLGRQYVQHVNKTYGRSGTLWEGRHKSSLVDAEHYLLSCYRYVELNPVTATMVKKPEEYPWSSYHFNALGRAGPPDHTT